jgi:disulfide bond formation protein DsbB
MHAIRSFFSNPRALLSIAFAQVLAAISGSLYFSNVALFVPCDLCWWQRIMMYPQVILLGIALWRKDYGIAYYSLPIVSIGWLIAAYHTVLYYNANYFNPSTVFMPCSLSGTSCTTKYIDFFGFVTIPSLALTAFTVIGACLIRTIIVTRKKNA